MDTSSARKPRLVFIANTMYSKIFSGGDVHTLNMAVTSVQRGFPLHCLAGHALTAELERRHLPLTVTLTDKGIMAPRDFNAFSGQLALLANNFERFRGTVRHLGEIKQDDIVYANTEFWWDSFPAFWSKGHRKLMLVGMDCPTLKEIACKSRPDVRDVRLPSLHYWLSQHLALQWFRRCASKRLLYVHPDQRARFVNMGYEERDLIYVGNGVDVKMAQSIPPQTKTYDAVWTGRVHHQKGIDDLVATLGFLAAQVKDFRGLLIGNLKHSLGPRIAAEGLAGCVEFSGYVSEEEKFRLLQCSRVFLMPSKYESWGLVIAEALASGLPVVAYELAAYRPAFGNLLHYVPPFDAGAFKRAAVEEVQKCRAGEKRLDEQELARFTRENSWEAVGNRFIEALGTFD